jgi:hypothetical protein
LSEFKILNPCYLVYSSNLSTGQWKSPRDNFPNDHEICNLTDIQQFFSGLSLSNKVVLSPKFKPNMYISITIQRWIFWMKHTVYSHCLELGWVKFLSKSRTSLCINIYNLTPVESNSDESKFWLSRIKVLVPRCRKPYYLHSLSRIYLSRHVYYLGIKTDHRWNIRSSLTDIFTLGYFTCLFHNLSN